MWYRRNEYWVNGYQLLSHRLFAQHGVLEGKKPASSGRTRQTLLASFDDIPVNQ